MRWIWLVSWLGLCFAVAGVSGSWTASQIPGWYRTLVRPVIAPPNWVFGPVWTLLYALMAVAAWQVCQSPASPARAWGLGLFLVQLALNFAWSLIFFAAMPSGPRWRKSSCCGRPSEPPRWSLAGSRPPRRG